VAAVLVVLLGRYCWENWNNPIFSIDFGEPDGNLWRLTWGAAAETVAAIAALSLLPAFARNILRLADYRKTIYEITVGAGMSVIGWLAAQLHLLVFDKLYIRWGGQERLLGSQNKISKK